MLHDFPPLENWQATKVAIRTYSKMLAELKRARIPPHPNWWHIGLRINPLGLTTTRLPLAAGGDPAAEDAYEVSLDFITGQTHVSQGGGTTSFPLKDGVTLSEYAAKVEDALIACGATNMVMERPRERVQGDTPLHYDESKGRAYGAALLSAHSVFASFRDQVAGDFSPINFWTHHADMSLEWFGTRKVQGEDGGEARAQIGFGFAPGDETHEAPYFYASPWPFDHACTKHALPDGARWETEGFSGALLPYSALKTDVAGAMKLQQFMVAVYRAAAPGLNAK